MGLFQNRCLKWLCANEMPCFQRTTQIKIGGLYTQNRDHIVAAVEFCHTHFGGTIDKIGFARRGDFPIHRK